MTFSCRLRIAEWEDETNWSLLDEEDEDTQRVELVERIVHSEQTEEPMKCGTEVHKSG